MNDGFFFGGGGGGFMEWFITCSFKLTPRYGPLTLYVYNNVSYYTGPCQASTTSILNTERDGSPQAGLDETEQAGVWLECQCGAQSEVRQAGII